MSVDSHSLSEHDCNSSYQPVGGQSTVRSNSQNSRQFVCGASRTALRPSIVAATQTISSTDVRIRASCFAESSDHTRIDLSVETCAHHCSPAYSHARIHASTHACKHTCIHTCMHARKWTSLEPTRRCFFYKLWTIMLAWGSGVQRPNQGNIMVHNLYYKPFKLLNY